ncbi:MAG: insulinase family protein [Candidatus Eisenbacteria bacterium]|nr:insulinase family protein [Candidatus Eisenbacteria bacterium]
MKRLSEPGAVLPRRAYAATLSAVVTSLMAATAAMAAVVTPAAPSPRFPEPVSRTLANGLRVVVFPSGSLPIVQAQLLVPAGTADEPDSLPGLAELTSRIVQAGSASRTREQLAADLGAAGATLAISAQRDYALAACGARSSSFDAALEIMADVVVSPRLEEEPFQSAQGAMIARLRSRARSEAALADDRMWGIALDPHPYGHPEGGVFDGLLETHLEDVKNFVRDRWRPDRAVLAIAGDVTPEHAFAAAQDVFGRWAGKVAADRARPAPAPQAGVRLMDLPGSPRAEVRVLVRGPGRAAPELAAWQVARAALEDRLAGSGASVALTSLRDASLLVLADEGPADSARAIAGRLLGTLRGFAASPPTGASEKALQHRVAQSVPLELETIGARISRWQADDFAGLTPDAVTHAITAIASPSLDLAPVARALGAPPTVFVAGPADRVQRLLAPLGKVASVPISVRRTSRPDTLPAPTAEQLRAGRAAIAGAIEAHGGAARLASAKSSAYEGDIGIESRGQKVEGQYSVVRVDPMQLSQSTRMLTFEIRQTLNGNEAWTLGVGDTASLKLADSLEVRSLQSTFQGDLVHLLRAAADEGSGAALRGAETIGGSACDLVDFTAPGGQRLRLAIDRATKRVVAADAGLGSDLRWHERRLFSEWKTVLGLVLPAFEERLLDGERVTYYRTRLITLNGDHDPSLFRKPTVMHGRVLPSK